MIKTIIRAIYSAFISIVLISIILAGWTGYTFISQEAALTDEAYQSEITKYGNWGISWIDRWAMSRGKKGEFFKDDPQTPSFVKDYKE